ncbi:hypothetical protein UCDDS831_g02013 [Diplodia seriata]|uniref:Uncharacterized protein n=1 Tax=Diplodia seriata TaxID=420778 RepID=A0A0G2HAQ3_9PEZI|nr:hypothetical protein UCDDS831_g02013 [Diplodia seriata]
MKFLVAAAAFLASYPEDLRTIEISDVVIRDNNGIYAIRFSLPTIHEEVFAAGHDLDAKRLPVPHFNYTWHATGTKKRFMLTLYNSNKTSN